MAVTASLALAVQTIVCYGQLLSYELSEAMGPHMQQLGQYLSQPMTRLLQQVDRSGSAGGALLFAAPQTLRFWAASGVLHLLFGLCWWLMKRRCQPANSSKGNGATREKAQKEEHQEKPSAELGVERVLGKRLLDLAESFTMVRLLMDELLDACEKITRNSFLPRLEPVIEVESTVGGWIPCQDDAIYRLVVPLTPPRGHTFCLEPGTADKERPVWNPSLRVELRCTCMQEPLEEDMLCFLHHPEEELREKQDPSLLHTLCTGPNLDAGKTTGWFQTLVTEAWATLPQSRYCSLTLLPSNGSCKLRMTDTSTSRTILIDMTFAAVQGNWCTFLGID